MRQWQAYVSAYLLGSLIAALTLPARGADIRFSSREERPRAGYAEIIVEGNVEAGDYEKLLKLVEQKANDDAQIPDSVFLASPGGDLLEAIKIGRLVRRLRMSTHIPSNVPLELETRSVGKQPLADPKSNRICASACFFVFVAGIDRERNIFPPLLAVHRPSLAAADLKKLSGNDVLSSASQMRKLVDGYLKEMDVPTTYAELMFSIPKDQLRMIDDDDFKRDLEGMIPELQDWIVARCESFTDVEKDVRNKLRREKYEKLSQSEIQILNASTIRSGECRVRELNQLQWEAWEQFKNH